MIANLIAALGILAGSPGAAIPASPPDLGDEVDAFLRILAVPGHEDGAAAFIRQRLGRLPARTDALGNVTLTLGSGPPRRLIACPLDEPGYVVGDIRRDGYLRLRPIGRAPRGRLWDQFHEGQKLVIQTAAGPVTGALGVRSIHLNGRGDDVPFSLADAYVDVGAENAAQVAALGIRLLDPVGLIRRPVRLAGDLLAGPSARSRAACVALADAARRVATSRGLRGTTVFAWTSLDLLGRKGLEALVHAAAPFQEVYLFAPQAPPPASYTGGPDWKGAHVNYLGLPSRYADTPVETVSLRDVARLDDSFVVAAGGRPDAHAAVPAMQLQAEWDDSRPTDPRATGDTAAAALLGSLIATYGVSGDEARVRAVVRSLLPAWAKPTVDAKGNLSVTFGSGPGHVLFVAHMDEVGFRVDSILPDGRLHLERRGGLYPSLWEAQAALVHLPDGRDVPAVVEPRPDWRNATHRSPTDSLTAFVGAGSPDAVAALGIHVGATVTMPKHMRRIGEHRAVARSFDDRVGDAAQLLALRAIDPRSVHHKVTFAWVVEEEVGLFGSQALANDPAMADVTEVHSVDTFVSSDAPLESHRFADAPLGAGAVVRALDTATITPRHWLDRVLAAAQQAGIPIQYGVTNGGSDAAPFVAHGAIAVPLSWPGRYSHSPVEVADFRDVEALARLIEMVL